MELRSSNLIQKPEKGRVFIFSPEGSVLYDSLRDSGSAYVPSGGFIELIGHAGDVFNVISNKLTVNGDQ